MWTESPNWLQLRQGRRVKGKGGERTDETEHEKRRRCGSKLPLRSRPCQTAEKIKCWWFEAGSGSAAPPTHTLTKPRRTYMWTETPAPPSLQPEPGSCFLLGTKSFFYGNNKVQCRIISQRCFQNSSDSESDRMVMMMI